MKVFRYFTAVAVLVAWTACNNEELNMGGFANDPDAVRINATVGRHLTRSNPIEGEGADPTRFNKDDKILVGTLGQGNVVYTYNGTSWLPDGDTYLKWNKDSHVFEARYPGDNYDILFDQRTLAALQKSDIMRVYGTTQKKVDGNIKLNFERTTSRIVISKIIERGNQYDETYSITELIVHTLVEEYPIQPYEDEDNYYALVHQCYGGLPNSKFLTIKVKSSRSDSEEITHIVKGIPDLRGGKSYQFELRIGKNKAEISSVTVEDWQTGSVVDGDKETTEKGLETSIDETTGVTTYKVWTYPALQEVNGILTSLDGKTNEEIDKIMASKIILMDNITLPAVAEGGSNWTPIGQDEYYVGTFDGNGYAITNMVVNQPTVANQALVSFLSLNGVIKNLTLIGCRVTASQYAAGILAKGNKGQMENCHVIATPGHDVVITAQETHWAAGVVCEISDNSSSYDYLKLKDCSLVADGGSVTITAAQSHAGGLAYRSNMNVANCHVKAVNGGTISIKANGTETSTSGRAGGLMVTLDSSRHTTENCSVIADGGTITITGKDRVAGFISEYSGIIKNCQVSGVNITGTSRVAGFMGILHSGTVETSSVTGCSITGTTNVNWAVIENQVEGYTPEITDGGGNTVNGTPTK